MTENEKVRFLRLFNGKREITRSKLECYIEKYNIEITDYREYPIYIANVSPYSTEAMTAHPTDIFKLTDEGKDFIDKENRRQVDTWFTRGLAIIAIIISVIALLKP